MTDEQSEAILARLSAIERLLSVICEQANAHNRNILEAVASAVDAMRAEDRKAA